MARSPELDEIRIMERRNPTSISDYEVELLIARALNYLAQEVPFERRAEILRGVINEVQGDAARTAIIDFIRTVRDDEDPRTWIEES